MNHDRPFPDKHLSIVEILFIIITNNSDGSRISRWGGTEPLGAPTSDAGTFL